MVVERLWPLALPALLVAGLFLCVAWFGLFRLMPDWLRIAVAAAFALSFLAALVPLRRFRAPGAAEIDRRIERANALEHAPVTTQTDRLSGGDGFADALWREHQRRMAERLDGLAGDLPRPRIPERDPWGARAAVALLLVVAFAFSGGPFGGSVLDAFRPAAARDVVPARIDAWVTPPPYTRRPPLFLTSEANRQQQVFNVPAGSDFAVRVTGGSGTEALTLIDEAGENPVEPAGVAAEGKAAATRQFGGKLTRDGMLALSAGERRLQSWAFQVVPDNPPTIELADDPRRAVNGTLELNYTITDDYGAASAEAQFVHEDAAAPGARPLFGPPEMPLGLPRRGAKDGAARTSRDLTEHPWAGSQVTMTLSVKDAAGQEGRSAPKEFVLPERPFSNPLARAVIEQRRILALDANKKGRVLALMDATTLRADETFDNPSHYLGIVTARTRLAMARTDDQLREVVDYLWEIALGIEEGDLSAAEKRLRQAQEALRNALKNGASDEEIERLMQELRQAMQQFLREFAERQMQNPNSAMQMPENMQELRPSDLDRMLDQIEDLAKSGARDQAEQLLSQLQDMMNNLQMGQRQQQNGQGQQQSQMRQQMDQLGEMLRRQQELMNETFQLDQQRRGQQQRGRLEPGQQGQQGQQGQRGQQGQQGQPMTPEEFAEAMRQLQQGQGELQQQLEAFMEALRGMGLEPGEGFGDAGEAMGQAEQALGDSDGETAVGEQGRALEAMRRGAQDMMEQMQQAMQGDEGGSGEGRQRSQHSDRDPLGRPRATTGPDFGDSVKVPDEIDVQRARRILEEIRRRLGNALSPELERNYLERLLDMQ